ncbi:ATP synthase subunit f, mitochondrial [Wickerhamiella sorbophila]|uniref:ATP synthase subunit f, mitochondrial n=1 Tax=Wickerhamiella sorbophila TaxID=45607 RepID=A0A2T0FGI8_9ASCO|nr:ATP synthase subunit f, mitochondrial [Wickerhamiella sorbophila]PRT54108.1 ATP synthase subunit f, mitochondrial [Wickerhamiella sorbophila]
MSYVAKRGLSTLIPPKIASAQNLGAAPNAKRMTRVVNFYKGLPQGPAPQSKATGFAATYRKKFVDNGSSRPLVHGIILFLTLGYSLDYYFHLRHEGEH